MSGRMGETEGLRAYMAWAGGDPSDVALCIFAHTAREAKRLAFPDLRWMTEAEWTEVRTRWLRSGARQHADPVKLAEGVPHVVDNPESCPDCECWYAEPLGLDGLCEACSDRRAWDAEDDIAPSSVLRSTAGARGEPEPGGSTKGGTGS